MGKKEKGKYYIIKRIENKIRRRIESSSIYWNLLHTIVGYINVCTTISGHKKDTLNKMRRKKCLNQWKKVFWAGK